MNNIYRKQCESDNAFTKKARLLQSMYRVKEVIKHIKTSKQKDQNMISLRFLGITCYFLFH